MNTIHETTSLANWGIIEHHTNPRPVKDREKYAYYAIVLGDRIYTCSRKYRPSLPPWAQGAAGAPRRVIKPENVPPENWAEKMVGMLLCNDGRVVHLTREFVTRVTLVLIPRSVVRKYPDFSLYWWRDRKGGEWNRPDLTGYYRACFGDESHIQFADADGRFATAFDAEVRAAQTSDERLTYAELKSRVEERIHSDDIATLTSQVGKSIRFQYEDED